MKVLRCRSGAIPAMEERGVKERMVDTMRLKDACRKQRVGSAMIWVNQVWQMLEFFFDFVGSDVEVSLDSEGF